MILRPPTTLLARLFVALALGCCAITAHSQQMPQDNWRYDGLQFADPDHNAFRSIAAGSGGVYAGEVNQGNPTKVIQFTAGGVYVRRFAADFTYILGIACDPTGNVYVFDSGNALVSVFDQNGAFLRSWGGPGSGNGQFTVQPGYSFQMIAVDKDSQVYVCDPGNSRVQVFTSTGAFISAWGQTGNLPGQFPAGCPYMIACAPNGEIYVGPVGGYYLSVFAADGTYHRSGSPYYSYYGFVFSPDGLLAVVTPYSSSLSILDSAFTGIASFGPNFDIGAYLGLAMNSRGDIYAISNNQTFIKLYEREYSSVQNSLLPPAIPQPVVLSAVQRAGVSLMDIDYRVTDADSATVTTGALAFKDGNNTLNDVVVMSTFTEGTGANIGANQPTGTSRHLAWNMAADWTVDFAQVQIEIQAKDSRNFLGVHWITVPASGSNPAVQISAAPIPDAQLLDLWYYFLGTRQPDISLANGSVTGTTGIYAGQTLASGVSTTTAGRLYLYEKMGVRPIANQEIAQALAGNYGFVSVNGNSVVKVAAATASYLQAWGYNGYGEATTSLMSAGAVKVAAGDYHSLFLKNDGTLWAMGLNNCGQLGDGTTTTASTPEQIATSVTQVAAGGNHSLFVKTDGSLWAMGNNSDGEIGDGTSTNRATPVQVAVGVIGIAAGAYHSFFIKADGSLWAMGYNGYGGLGDGTTTSRLTPVQVAAGATRVAAGAYHSLFIKTDGTLWGMGHNSNGELGDGAFTNNVNTPEQVATGVSQVAAGSDGYHTLFVTTDGMLWAMGYNGYGQLGDGTSTSRSAAVQVAANVALIAGGDDHSLFVKTDGTLWAMGFNNHGQLADGTNSNHSTPLQVGLHVTAVAAGAGDTLAIISAP